MKKIAKLSLVAAIAVAGLTNVNAASLEEAIKGVNISGNIEYTMEKVGNANYTSTDAQAQHDLDIRVKAVVPVTDNISATIRVDERNDDDTDADNSGSTTLNSSSSEIEIDRAYFTYKNNSFTANAGLVGAPLTDAAQGDGASISANLGSATVAAGYLYNTAVGSQEVAFAAISGSFAPVSYSATYATLMGGAEADFLHLALSGDLGAVSLGADYSQMTPDVGNDQSQYKLSASADIGIVSLGLAYAENDSNGGSTLIDGSDVAASNISVSALELQSLGDASAYQVDLSADVTSSDTLAATYASADINGAADQTAIKLTATHKFAKNFKVYANYEINDNGSANDMTELTLGAKYSF